MLGFRDRPQWRTVTGGSRRYVEEITRPFADRIRLNAAVRAITRHHDHVEVAADGCETRALRRGRDRRPTPTRRWPCSPIRATARRELLGAIAYQPNEAVLHTDASLLPRRRAAWASWNYHLTDPPPPRTTLTYWMNSLQSIRSATDFCVTLNRTAAIDPSKVIRTIAYSHPVFTPEGVAAQARHGEISGVNRTHYCGAYWRWGFHEDGVVSALRALTGVGRTPVAA